MVRPGFTVPILSSLPDIPHLYTTNPALSFIVDALALATMFAALLSPLGVMLFAKGDDKSKAMGKKFGAVLGVILGLSAAFALRRAGIPLFEYWLTTVIAAAVIGIALFMMLQKLTGGKYKLITGLLCLLIAWMIMDFWFVTSNNPTVRNVFGFISLIGPSLFVLFLIWVLTQLTGKGAPGGGGGGGTGGGGGGFWKKFGDGLGGALGWVGNNLIKKPFGGIYDAFKAVGKDIPGLLGWLKGWWNKSKKSADEAKKALDKLESDSAANDKNIEELDRIARELQKLIDENIGDLERARQLLERIRQRIAALEAQINDIGIKLQACATREGARVSAELLHALATAARTLVMQGGIALDEARAALQQQGVDAAVVERVLQCMAGVLSGQERRITPVNVDIAKFIQTTEEYLSRTEAEGMKPSKQLISTITSIKNLKDDVERALLQFWAMEKTFKEINVGVIRAQIDAMRGLPQDDAGIRMLEELDKKFQSVQDQMARLQANFARLKGIQQSLQRHMPFYEEQGAKMEEEAAQIGVFVKQVADDIRAVRALLPTIIRQPTPEAQLGVTDQVSALLLKITRDDLLPLRAGWKTVNERLQNLKSIKQAISVDVKAWARQFEEIVGPALAVIAEFSKLLEDALKKKLLIGPRPAPAPAPEPAPPAPAGGGEAAPPAPPATPVEGPVKTEDIIVIMEAEKQSLSAAVDKIAKLVESLQFEEQFKKQKSKAQTEEKAKALVRAAVKESEVELDIDKKKIAASVENLEKVAHTVGDAITLLETSALPESQVQLQQLKMIRGNLLIFIRAQPDLVAFLTKTKEALASTVAEYVVGSKGQTVMQSTAKRKLDEWVQALREWIAFISAEEVKLEKAHAPKTVIIPGPTPTETGRPPRAKPKSVR